MTFCLIFKHEGSRMVGFWEGIAAGISQLSLVEKTKQVTRNSVLTQDSFR